MRIGTTPITEKQGADRAGLGDIAALVASRAAGVSGGVRSGDKQTPRSEAAQSGLGSGQLGSRGKDRFGLELAQKRQRIDRADDRLAKEKAEPARSDQDSSRLESRRQDRAEQRESAVKARQERLQEQKRLQDRDRLSQSERLEKQSRSEEVDLDEDQPEDVEAAGRDVAFDELVRAQRQRGAIDGVSDELGLLDAAAAVLAPAQAEDAGDELVSDASADLLQNAGESESGENTFGLAGFGSASTTVIPRWAEPGAFGKLGNTTPGGNKPQVIKLDNKSVATPIDSESAVDASGDALQETQGGLAGFDLEGFESTASNAASFEGSPDLNRLAATKQQAELGKNGLAKETADPQTYQATDEEADADLVARQTPEDKGAKSGGEQQASPRDASATDKPSRLSRDEGGGGLFDSSAKAKGNEQSGQENGRSAQSAARGSSSGLRFSNQDDQQSLIRDVASVFGSGAFSAERGTGTGQPFYLAGKGSGNGDGLGGIRYETPIGGGAASGASSTSTGTGDARAALATDHVPTNAAQATGAKGVAIATSAGGAGADLQTKLAEAAAGFGQAAEADSADSGGREAAFLRANVGGIVTGVKGQLLPGGGKMTLQLDPPELGVLQVKLEMKDGAAFVSFATSNDQASEVLSHSLSKLKNALEASGLTVERMAVERTVVSASSSADRANQDRGSNDRSTQQSTEGKGPSGWDDQASGRDQGGSGQKARDEATDRAWRAIYGDPLDVLG